MVGRILHVPTATNTMSATKVSVQDNVVNPLLAPLPNEKTLVGLQLHPETKSKIDKQSIIIESNYCYLEQNEENLFCPAISTVYSFTDFWDWLSPLTRSAHVSFFLVCLIIDPSSVRCSSTPPKSLLATSRLNLSVIQW